MTYLLLGNDEIINEKIKDIITENNINPDSISKYNLETDNVLLAIDDINTLNMFGDKKIVIATNLKNIINKEDEKNDIYINSLIKYLENQSDNILILCGDQLPRKKKLVECLEKNCIKIETSDFDMNSYIKNLFEDYNISNINIEILKNYCSNDISRIKHEIEKLKLYKLEDKTIIKEDNDLLVSKNLDNTIFDLINNIEKNNKKEAFNIYRLLKENNEEDMKILSMLANNYRLIYQVKNLSINKSDKEIGELLAIKNPKRISVLKNKGYNFTNDYLKKALSLLAELDYKIKTGLIDKEYAVCLFIANNL